MYRVNQIKIRYLLLFAFIQFPLRLTGRLHYLSYVYVYAWPLAYLIINNDWVLKFLHHAKGLKLQTFKRIFIYLFAVSVITPLLHGTFDFSYIGIYWTDLFLWLIKYLFLICVFEKHIDNTGNIELFVDYFTKSVSLYVLFSLLSTITPIRSILMNILYFSDSDIINLQRGEYWTRYGWSGWSGFNETAICTIAVILNGLLMLTTKYIKLQRKHLVAIILPIIGNALYGRIGLFASVVFMAFLTIYIITIGDIRRMFRIISIILIGLIGVIIFKDKISFLDNWMEWVFSAFENYRTYGKFYDNMGTLEHLLKDMYWMPELSTFLFGDGFYIGNDGAYYMHTDSGIMRPILYYGALNYALSLIATFTLIQELVIKTCKINNKRKNRIFVLSIIVILLIFEYKGESLWMFIPILFPLALMARKYLELEVINI